MSVWNVNTDISCPPSSLLDLLMTSTLLSIFAASYFSSLLVFVYCIYIVWEAPFWKGVSLSVFVWVPVLLMTSTLLLVFSAFPIHSTITFNLPMKSDILGTMLRNCKFRFSAMLNYRWWDTLLQLFTMVMRLCPSSFHCSAMPVVRFSYVAAFLSDFLPPLISPSPQPPFPSLTHYLLPCRL